MVLSMDRWNGKVAVVTGASSGIGAALAQRLVEEGMQVAAVARRKDRLDALAKKLECKKGKLHPIQADVAHEEDILKAFKYIKDNLGPVHVLINNAGVQINNDISNGKTEDWLQILKVNVLALNVATREAVNDMMANKVDGHIVHINSVAGHTFVNMPGINMYTASKHAVTALTESHRVELNRLQTKIKVTSISPGLVDTEMTRNEGISEEVKPIDSKHVKLRPEDIVDGVIYTLSTPPHVQVHEIMIKPVGEMF